MKLLNLSDGRKSLEFVPSEWASVKSGLEIIAGRNRYSVREEATHDVIVVGDAELILMDEWDEPCLVSMSDEGDRLLSRIKLQVVRSHSRALGTDRKRGTAIAA